MSENNLKTKPNQSYTERYQRKLLAELETARQELKAYELLIQGLKILADLADQRGPGQAAMYRIQLDGYTKAAEQCRRTIQEIEQVAVIA